MYKFNPKVTSHRRGDYNAVSIGVSYGGGQQVRMRDWHCASGPHALIPRRQIVKLLSHAKHNEDVVDAILSARAVKRVANFGSGG